MLNSRKFAQEIVILRVELLVFGSKQVRDHDDRRVLE